MNFLVVSDREYRKTSRGIDIIAAYLNGEGHSVDHLVFFKRNKIPSKLTQEGITQLYFYDPIKLYRSRLQFLFPGFILLLYFKLIIKRQSSVDFSKYDYVVIESGHPIYLGLYITNKIIYRQSDPTSITFNSNRDFYKRIEGYIIEKSIFTTSALEDKYHIQEYSNKIFYWHSGFIPCKKKQIIKLDKIFIILGGELDWHLITRIAKMFINYRFYIVGITTKKHLPENVIAKGYIEYNEYQAILSSSLSMIVPFSKHYTNQLREVYFTAKILASMDLGIPILLRAYGSIQKSEDTKKLFVYKTETEAIELLSTIILKIKSEKINRIVSKSTREFLIPQTSKNRIKELGVIFGRFIK